MIVNSVNLLLALGTPPGDGKSSAPPWANFVPLLLMVFVFYFIFIRPQQKKARDHQSLLSAIKAGDKVVTASGIIGVVISVKDKSLSIRSADTKLEILKSAVSEITGRESDSTNS